MEMKITRSEVGARYTGGAHWPGGNGKSEKVWSDADLRERARFIGMTLEETVAFELRGLRCRSHGPGTSSWASPSQPCHNSTGTWSVIHTAELSGAPEGFVDKVNDLLARER